MLANVAANSLAATRIEERNGSSSPPSSPASATGAWPFRVSSLDGDEGQITQDIRPPSPPPAPSQMQDGCKISFRHARETATDTAIISEHWAALWKENGATEADLEPHWYTTIKVQ